MSKLSGAAMGGGSAKQPAAAMYPGPPQGHGHGGDADQAFLQAEGRRRAGKRSAKESTDHFEALEKLDTRVPRDERSLEVVLRMLQESSGDSTEAIEHAHKAAQQANIVVQELSQKLCPRISKALAETRQMLQDPDAENPSKLTWRLKHFERDQAKCDYLKDYIADLAEQQRQAAATLTVAHHKQLLATNASVQALMNPVVGLNPRKFKAYIDEGHRRQPVAHKQQCHMECSKMKSHIEWPFENDPEQRAREGTAASGESADPAVGRFPVLDARSQGQVKQLLGRSFL